MAVRKEITRGSGSINKPSNEVTRGRSSFGGVVPPKKTEVTRGTSSFSSTNKPPSSRGTIRAMPEPKKKKAPPSVERYGGRKMNMF